MHHISMHTCLEVKVLVVATVLHWGLHPQHYNLRSGIWLTCVYGTAAYYAVTHNNNWTHSAAGNSVILGLHRISHIRQYTTHFLSQWGQKLAWVYCTW